MNDLISVVVPVYNVEKYLKRCIDSIKAQTYKNLEIILVDDGSPDSCGKICDKYASDDGRIKVIHKENGGLSDARNAGINIASGKYITFIDSDDYITHNCVEVLYNAIIFNDSDISIGLHVIEYDNKKTSYRYVNQKNTVIDSKKALEKILYDEGLDVSAWGKLYKLDLFDKIRFPKGRLYEDSATTYKLVDKAKKISLVNKYIYYYAIRKNSISSCNFNEGKMDLVYSTKEMTDYIQQKYPELINGCERRLMYAYLSTLTQLAKSQEQKKYVDTKKVLMEYIKTNGKRVLADKKIPKRDRIGIILCMMGYPVFRVAWKLYEKINK